MHIVAGLVVATAFIAAVGSSIGSAAVGTERV